MTSPATPLITDERIVEHVAKCRTDTMRLDQYLAGIFSDYSRSVVQKVIDAGGVWVNGKTVKASHKVRHGDVIHILPPAIGFEMATITDFNGVIAAAEIQGTAQGTDGTQYTFDTDMRFMQGTYVGMDGRRYRGAFGFI